MPSTTGPLAPGWTRMGRALFVSGTDCWTRSWEIGLRYLRLAADLSVRDPDGRSGSRGPGGALFDAYRHFITEMAMVPGLAAERFAAELTPADTGAATAAAAPPPVEGRSIRLPARVEDAAQGLAMYAVPARAVEEALAERALPFVPVDLGRGAAALAIFGVRYVLSDLGTYDEIGFAFLVAPRQDPLAMGLHFFELPVSSRFSCAAGKAIWGYAKTEETIDVAAGESETSWTLRRKAGSGRVLTITFPRGGGGSSTAIPLPTYTLLGGRPHRTVFVRTGRGERILAGGGRVMLALGDEQANAGDGLWRTLRRLGLPAAPVILHAWTEHMSGEMGAPLPLSQRDHCPPAA